MEITTSKTSIRSGDCLIVDILCSEFGCQIVRQALEYKRYYDYFKKDNFSLLLVTVNTLSYEWQMGRAKEYLESLALDLQYYLICHLAEGYIIDKTRADYLPISINSQSSIYSNQQFSNKF